MLVAFGLAGADALELPKGKTEHDEEGDKGKDDGRRYLNVHNVVPLLFDKVVM